jgi:lipoprotein-anchoring transpeptidase ErfK/SrfK
MRFGARALLALTALVSISATPSPSLTLHVDLSERLMDVRLEGESVQTYPVGIGTSKHPTPTGSFWIRRIIWNPRWVPPRARWARGKRATPPGHPNNPMKIVKIYFRVPDYYIHGTAELLSVGEEGSHGCLRMTPTDVAELGKLMMDRGGRPQPDHWYGTILKPPRETAVRLRTPAAIHITP